MPKSVSMQLSFLYVPQIVYYKFAKLSKGILDILPKILSLLTFSGKLR